MAPRWKVNAAGQCQVERKEETVARLGGGQSPDDADAFNLAGRAPPAAAAGLIREPRSAAARGLFGGDR